MSWYTVTHFCGHDEDHQLYGKHSSRDRRRERMAEEPCSDCQKAARAAHNAQCAEANVEAGLPALKGSNKQIAWAESIRGRMLETAETRIATYREMAPIEGEHVEQAARTIAAAERIVASWRAETSAGRWIDRRTDRADWLDDEVRKAMSAVTS